MAVGVCATGGGGVAREGGLVRSWGSGICSQGPAVAQKGQVIDKHKVFESLLQIST